MYYYKPDVQEKMFQYIKEHSISSDGIVKVVLKDDSIQKFNVIDKNNRKAYEKKPDSDEFKEIKYFPKENLELIAKEFEYAFRKKGTQRKK